MEASVAGAAPPAVKFGNGKIIPVPPKREASGGPAVSSVPLYNLPGSTSADGLTAGQVDEIIRYLQQAQQRIREKVNKVIEKYEKESKETEKAAKKKKMETKANILEKKAAQLARRMMGLRSISVSPAGQEKVGGLLAVVEETAKKLAGLEGVSETEFEAMAVQIEQLLVQAQRAIEEAESPFRDNSVLTAIFGPSYWQTTGGFFNIPNPFDVDSAGEGADIIGAGEVTAAGREVLAASGLSRALESGQLTSPFLRRYARAFKEFAFLLNGSLGVKINQDSELYKAFQELMRAADKGELTRDKLNEIFGKFGVEFTPEAFSAAFLGKVDGGIFSRLLAPAETVSVDQFIGAMHDLMATMRAETGRKVNLDDIENLDDPTEEERLNEASQTYCQKLQEFGLGTNFYIIDHRQHSRLFATMLLEQKLHLSVDPAKTYWEQLAEVRGNDDFPPALKTIIEEIENLEGLNDQLRWEKLVDELLERLQSRLEKMAGTGIKDPQKRQMAVAENARNFFTFIQKEPPDSKAMKEYQRQFVRIFIERSEEPLDMEKIRGANNAQESLEPVKLEERIRWPM